MLRFVQECGTESVPVAAGWHGTIRHVQSNKQVRFTRIEDALKFMADYVPITSEQLADKEFPLDDKQ